VTGGPPNLLLHVCLPGCLANTSWLTAV
jgi:hypothetical protein